MLERVWHSVSHALHVGLPDMSSLPALSSVSSALVTPSPKLKVWVDQTHISPNNDPFDMLNVQSREEKPIMVKRVLMNDDPKCVNMEASIAYHADKPVKLGKVLRFGLGIHGFNACAPVKVLVSTDRGDSVYTFE